MVIENCFIIRDMKLIQGESGLFVSMPSRRRKDGTFKDVAHPLNQETRQIIEQKVIEEFEKTMVHGDAHAHSDMSYSAHD
jgi:stage V sporulation protein G